MKIRFIFGLAMLMTVAGSCKKNEEKETNSFTASIEVDESSKTSLNGNKVFWETGDKIMVYNDNASHVYTLSGNGPTQLGTFTTTGGLQPTTSSYWGVYPYNSCTALNRGNDQFTFSFNASSQPYTSSGFADELNPMAGKNTNPSYPTRLYFRNAFSVLKIVATGNDCAIDAIELTTNGSNNSLTGTFVYDYGNQTLSLSSGTGNVITLTGISTKLTSSPQTFYFVVPPQALADGFTITYKNGTSTVDTKTVDASTVSSHYNLAPNKMLSLTMRVEAQVQYVHNLLPELDVNGQNWTVSRHILKNYNYDNSHYPNEALIPSGNTWVIETASVYFSQSQNQTVTCNEGFIYTANGHHPQLTVGHTYYISWLSRTETEQGKSITQEVFWPERAWHVIPVSNTQYVTSNTVLWKKNSYVFTLSQSIWIEDPQLGPVVDGLHKIRFDINNGGNNIRHFCFADPILIDLTADYTNQGRPIPNKATLDGKAYFFGQRDIDTW